MAARSRLLLVALLVVSSALAGCAGDAPGEAPAPAADVDSSPDDGAPDEPPAPAFLSSCERLRCRFEAPVGLDTTDAEWSFGDGHSARGPSPTHRFGAPGRFTVTLTAPSAEGTTARLSDAVEVRIPEPAAGESAHSDPLCGYRLLRPSAWARDTSTFPGTASFVAPSGVALRVLAGGAAEPLAADAYAAGVVARAAALNVTARVVAAENVTLDGEPAARAEFEVDRAGIPYRSLHHAVSHANRSFVITITVPPGGDEDARAAEAAVASFTLLEPLTSAGKACRALAPATLRAATAGNGTAPYESPVGGWAVDHPESWVVTSLTPTHEAVFFASEPTHDLDAYGDNVLVAARPLDGRNVTLDELARELLASSEARPTRVRTVEAGNATLGTEPAAFVTTWEEKGSVVLNLTRYLALGDEYTYYVEVALEVGHEAAHRERVDALLASFRFTEA